MTIEGESGKKRVGSVIAMNRWVNALICLCVTVFFSQSWAGDKQESEDSPSVTLPDRSLYFQGRYVFERNCVICHGKMGNGRGEMAKDLEPKPRSFKAAQFKYRTTPYGKLPTTEDLIRTIRGGVSGTRMGMFSNLSDREVKAVAEYVKFFSSTWRDQTNYAQAISLPEKPDWVGAESSGKRFERGMALFAQTCAPCHGEEGKGNGANAALLKDHLERPIKPANLRAEHLRTGGKPENMFKTITTGLNGTPMLGFHGVLTEEQRWEVVSYLVHLRKQK